MTSGRPHLQAQAPSSSEGLQGVWCLLLGTLGIRVTGVPRWGGREGLAWPTVQWAESSWLRTCPGGWSWGRGRQTRADYRLQCSIGLHLRSTNSDVKLLSIARWRLQSVRAPAWGPGDCPGSGSQESLPMVCNLQTFPTNGFQEARWQACEFNGKAFGWEYDMWLFLFRSAFEANQNVNPSRAWWGGCVTRVLTFVETHRAYIL